MRIVSESEVARLLDVELAVKAIRAAHLDLAHGTAHMPTRTTHSLEAGAEYNLMPALVPTSDAFGVKVVTFFPENPGRGLPSVIASVLLLEPTTGKPVALVAASRLTAIRTAAASAVATQALARADATTLAIIGCGVQGEAHLEVLPHVISIDRVLVASRSRSSAEALADRGRARRADLTIEITSPEDAVRRADIVCTTTTSAAPVVADGWLKPGTHVNAVGAHSPDARELESTTMAAARVIVDSRDAVRVECGECMIPITEGLVRRDHFDDELGQLLAGDVPGRRTNDEITVYESCGLAIQDMAVARAVVDRAIDTNEGHDVRF